MTKKILQFSHSFSDNRVPPQMVATILKRSGAMTSICYLFDNNTSNKKVSAYNNCDSFSFNHSKNCYSNNKIQNLIKLYKTLKSNHYNNVITHRFKPFFLALLLSRFFKNTKFCAIFHGNGSFDRHTRRWMCRFLLSDQWTIIAVSESVKKDILCTLGQTAAKIEVIYNCLDMTETQTNQLTHAAATDQLGLDADAFIFGCTARLVTGKGLHHLITAFSQLKTDKKVQLAIIGDGREKGSLEQQVQELGLQDKVVFCGYKENAVRFATAFDAFILPTTNEGFGLVLLEAAAAKIPLLASAVGGILEVASETEIIQFPVRDINAMVTEMTHILMMSDEQRTQLGERTFQQLYSKFDISQVAPDYYRLLDLNKD